MRSQLFPPFSMTSPPSSLDDYDAGDCVVVGSVMEFENPACDGISDQGEVSALR